MVNYSIWKRRVIIMIRRRKLLQVGLATVDDLHRSHLRCTFKIRLEYISFTVITVNKIQI